MTSQRRARWWLFLVVMIPAAALSRSARADLVGGQLSLSADAGLIHSTAVQQLSSTFQAGMPREADAIPYAGLSGVWTRGPWVAGVRGDLAHDLIFGRTESFVGAFGGGRLALGSGGWRLQVTAEAGEHMLWSIGSSLFLNPVNANARVPFAGATLDLAHPRRPGRDYVGLSAFVREDLVRQGLQVVGYHDGLFEDGAYSASYQVGGTTIGLALYLATN